MRRWAHSSPLPLLVPCTPVPSFDFLARWAPNPPLKPEAQPRPCSTGAALGGRSNSYERDGSEDAMAQEQVPAPKKTLKAALRELYKRVHPDLFHSHPEQREVNQRSFQVLQDFLGAAGIAGATGTGSHRPSQSPAQPGVAYHLQFYLWASDSATGQPKRTLNRPPVEAKNKGPETSGAHKQARPPSFSLVALTLPRPQPSLSRLGSIPAKVSLTRLLEACGIPVEDQWEGHAGTVQEGLTSTGKVNLRELLQYAAELQQKGQQHSSWQMPSGGRIHSQSVGSTERSAGPNDILRRQREEVVLRSALRRSHGIAVRFYGQAREHSKGEADSTARPMHGTQDRAQPQASPVPLELRIQNLKSLLSLLHSHPHLASLLRGASVVLGCPPGTALLDSQAQVHLPGLGEGGQASWLRVLQGSASTAAPQPEAMAVSPTQSHSQSLSSFKQLEVALKARRDTVTQRRKAELAAAREVEVDMFFADEATASQGEYLNLLHRLTAWAEAHGSVGGGRFAELPVRVFCPSRPPTAHHSESAGMRHGAGECTGAAEGHLSGAKGQARGEERQCEGPSYETGGHIRGENGFQSSPYRDTGRNSLGNPSSWEQPWAPNERKLEPGKENEGSSMRNAKPLFSVHTGLGYVAIPVTAEASDVFAFICAFGDKALKAKAEQKRRRDSLEALRHTCIRQLKLRRLSIDWQCVSREEAQTGLQRLLHVTRDLVNYTEGVSLCLSNKTSLPFASEYEIAQGKGDSFFEYFRLNWKFSIEDV